MRILVDGMSGIGDCLHQRAILPALMEGNEVWLRTPWPQLYHDMPKLHLVPLYEGTERIGRTAIKNEARSKHLYHREPGSAKIINCRYPGHLVREQGSIVGAMAAKCGVKRLGSFELPIPEPWWAQAKAIARHWNTTKPIMLYRPLVKRGEFPKGDVRNPDDKPFAEIFDSIRDRFFVVSVADLDRREEWIIGNAVAPDAAYHNGELTIEVIAAIAKMATLIFCPVGFAAILGQAVGTPTVCIFGGHESSMTISHGAKTSPTLSIDPIQPCDCFELDHRCRKEIDVPLAIERVTEFVERTLH